MGGSRSAIAEFIAAKGGAHRAVAILLRKKEELETDLHRVRERSREVPADAVVLTGDDARAWEAYRGLGKPDEVTRALDTAKADRAWRSERESADHIGQMAAAVGYNARLLTLALNERPDAKLELREVTVSEGGREVKKSVPHVVVGTGDAAKAEPLTAFATREFPDLPFTATASGAGNGTPSAGRTGSTTPAGGATPPVRYPDQREGGTPARPADPVSSYIASTQVLPSQRKKAAA